MVLLNDSDDDDDGVAGSDDSRALSEDNDDGDAVDANVDDIGLISMASRTSTITMLAAAVCVVNCTISV